MSTTLIDLPDEVLTTVFGYVDAKKFRNGDKRYQQSVRPTICALNLTCHRLSMVAFYELYRHVTFVLDETKAAPSWDQVQCVRSFTKTCRKRSSILQCIKGVDVIWHLTDDEDAVLESLLDVLAPSTSLTYLHLSLGEVGFELATSPCALRPLLQHDKEFLSLSVLEVIVPKDNEDGIGAELVYKLASLPSLKRLVIRSPMHGPEDDAFACAPQSTDIGRCLDLKDQNFDLESLEVVGSVCREVLQIMLPRCSNIRKIKTYVPGLEDDGECYDDHTENSCVSSRSISNALSSTSATLQELSINGPSYAQYITMDRDLKFDGSIMQLSLFMCLRRLEVSMLLLHLGDGHLPTDGVLQMMFPISLEELYVQYESPRGLLWGADSFADLRPSNDYLMRYRNWNSEEALETFGKNFRTRAESTDYVHGRVSWYLSVLDIRKSNSSVLPKLRKMKIIELDDVDWTFDKLEFVKKGYHPELFRDVGVKFEIVLRIPRGWTVPIMRELGPS